jgi:hypothetical protein
VVEDREGRGLRRANQGGRLTILSRKISWATKHWRAIDGPFEVKDGEWLLEEYWKPLHSFRVTPVDKARLCDGCAADAGQLMQEYRQPACGHTSEGCAGVRLEPIQFVFLDLPRRSGKTTGTGGLVGASLFIGDGERIGFVSGSEDQSDRLFDDHYAAPIRENPKLNKRANIVGSRVETWRKASDKKKGKPPVNFFEFVATSISGATGGKYTVFIVEEARNVRASVAAAALPVIWDQNGWECPRGVRGHTKTKGDLDDPAHPTSCTTCGVGLQPWVGKLLLMSSAGEKDGGERDWFFEACDLQEKEPHPRIHMYRAQEVINRKVAKSSVNATAEFFGKVESMRDFVEIETSNQARRRGEDFLSSTEIAACVDKGLSNQASGARPGVAFLDLSNVRDLTSLVICEDRSRPATEDTPAEPPWTRIVTARIDVFAPELKNHDIVSGGYVDDVKLEAYLDGLVPTFKLLRLRLDDRNDEKWQRLVARLRKKPWGRIVIGCHGTVKLGDDETDQYTDADRRFAWAEVERRFIGKTIRIQDHADLRRELVGARAFRDSRNREEIREAGSRNKKGVRHLDIAEALAGCCFEIHALSTKRRGPGMSAVRQIGRNVAERMANHIRENSQTPVPGRGPDSY